MKRRAAVACLVALVAVSCSRKEEQTPQQVARAKVKTNVTSSMTYAPLVIAREEGFFAAEGIDIDLLRIDANSGILAMTTGELDVLSSPIRSGHFNLMRRGVPLRIVADKGHFERGPCAPGAFTAPVAMADDIAAKGGTIRGRRVALHRGGVTEYLTERFITSRDLKKEDVDLVQLPSGGDNAAQARNDLAAIRFVQEPTLSSLLGNGTVKVIADIRDVAPGTQYNAVFFGKRLLHDDPELGKRFMRAYLRGVRQFNQGKTDRNVAIISGYTRLPAETIRRACWMAVAGDGHVAPEAVQPVLDWARERGYLEGKIDVAQWWDGRFVEAAR